MINFLLGVAVATGLFLFNMPFLLHYILKEYTKKREKEINAREGDDCP